MTASTSERMVFLIAKAGNILTHFATDREEFPAIATYERDRIFKLMFRGDLATLRDIGLPSGIVIEGAMYHEIDAWRVSSRSINKPRPRKRPRRTAKIFHFPRRVRP